MDSRNDVSLVKIKSPVKLITYISGAVSCIMIIFGSLFKILHLDGANSLLMLGMTLLAIIYVPSLAIYWFRKK